MGLLYFTLLWMRPITFIMPFLEVFFVPLVLGVLSLPV